jgi:hypothetical protein
MTGRCGLERASAQNRGLWKASTEKGIDAWNGKLLSGRRRALQLDRRTRPHPAQVGKCSTRLDDMRGRGQDVHLSHGSIS